MLDDRASEAPATRYEMMTGADAITRSLIDRGVDTLFGLPGVQLDNLFDSLYRHSDRVRTLHTRHEQGAAYMALGYAQATGKPGAFAVVPGPGVLNTTAALATAAGSNVPVLCLTGQIPSDQIGLRLGIPHELRDQLMTLRGVVRWAERAEAGADVPRLMDEAFRQMMGGRHQPVSLEMPPDTMGARGPVVLSRPSGVQAGPVPNPERVRAAARLLAEARRPAIFVGSGVFGAEAELLDLAEALGAPVVMSRTGRGALDDRHPLAMGMLEGQALWPEIDVVLVIGTRFMAPALSWGREKDVTVIRIDLDPVQLDKPRLADIPIYARAADGMAAITAMLPGTGTPWPADLLRAARDDVRANLRSIEPQRSLAHVLRDELPDDAVFVVDVTQLSSYIQFAMPIYRPRGLITAGLQGTLGYAFPTALGAQVACPDRQVVAIVGDGGFMFTMQELSTAVAHGINLITIVMNDNSFGNVRRFQKLNYGGRHIAVDLANPDFVKLADSFGIWARRANGADGLREALREAMTLKAPALIEVPVGELPNIWGMVKRPASQGRQASS